MPALARRVFWLLFGVLLAVAFLLPIAGNAAGKYPRGPVIHLVTPNASGTGVVIQRGLALTAGHVTEGDPKFSLGLTGKVIQAVYPSLSTNDLGAVRGAGIECPCAELADHDAELDEPVYMIGYPRGINTPHIVPGVVMGVGEVVVGLRAFSLADQLVISGQIEPGMSGGGAFVKRDGRWQLVGILTRSTSVSILATPVSTIRKWLEGKIK